MCFEILKRRDVYILLNRHTFSFAFILFLKIEFKKIFSRSVFIIKLLLNIFHSTAKFVHKESYC